MRSAPRRTVAESPEAVLCAVCAIVLAGVAGLAAGFVARGASAAVADDPQPTTVVQTSPAPDHAPQPAPAVKPKPKPAPTPHPPQSRRAPAPTPQPVAPAPAVRQAPVAKSRVRTPAKPMKKVQRKPKKMQRKKVVRKAPATPKAPASKTKVSKTLGVSVGLRTPAQPKSGSGGSRDSGSLLMVVALAIAIACLTIAMIPATALPWRPAAAFVSESRLDLTVIGVALLMIVTFMFLWTRAA